VIDNAFRSALLRRDVTLGTWLQINSATAAEVLSNTGYDWIAIDIEHTDIDVRSLTQLLRGMYGRGVAPIARVSRNDVLEIRRLSMPRRKQGVPSPQPSIRPSEYAAFPFPAQTTGASALRRMLAPRTRPPP
jgi:2-dehydro-3-deoxyglucarate aldolase